VNIESKLMDACTTCRAFELEATSASMYADCTVFDRTIVVDCANREMCTKIRDNSMKYDPLSGRRLNNVTD
jgi:hypothetical protein